MERQEIKASVIIPVYNVARYIPDCLDSILKQSLQEIELLCVNDGSTDESPKILHQYHKQDERVILLDYKMNKGQAYARNRALEKARGKYVYFVDADDMVKEGALEYLYEFMETENLDGALFSAEVVSEIKEKVDIESEMRHFNYPDLYTGPKMFSLLIGTSDYSHNVWRQFWSREYLLSNHLFFNEDTSPHEDLLFTFRALLLARRIKCINQAFYVYRKRENAVTTTKPSLKKLMAFINCYGESFHFIQKHQKSIPRELASSLGTFFSLEKNYIVDMALSLCRNGFDISSLDVKNGYYCFILNAFVFNRYQFIPEFISKDVLMRIKESEYVIVYGAGKVGSEVMDQLRRYQFERVFVAETKPRTKTEEERRYYSIYSIADLAEYKNRSLVLVSVTPKFQKELVGQLKKLGFSNYLCVTKRN